MALDPQLRAIVSDLESAQDRLAGLYAEVSSDVWRRRPGEGRWSPAECLAHLNLTSRALVPLLRAGIEQAQAHEVEPARLRRYRRDVTGWLIWMAMAPSAGFRTRTTPAFIPSEADLSGDLVSEFVRLQADVIACVRAAEGLPIHRVMVVSPFGARVKYNLYAALTLVSRHQHRHLRQAERAARASAPDSRLAVYRRAATP